jgi:hypothetical protein
MPYKSKRQRRWAHTEAGMEKLGPAKVAEFDQASKGKKLPERSKKPKKGY